MKYPVMVTETFSKYIIVEADNEKEAIEKCWDEYYDKRFSGEKSPVYFEYLDRGDTEFINVSEKKREAIMKYENSYEHL